MVASPLLSFLQESEMKRGKLVWILIGVVAIAIMLMFLRAEGAQACTTHHYIDPATGAIQIYSICCDDIGRCVTTRLH
jgi:hypothetical protein